MPAHLSSGDDRGAIPTPIIDAPRPRRERPALHVAGGSELDVPTCVRRARERDAHLDPHTREALEIVRDSLAAHIPDAQAREHAARNLVTALMPVIRQPDEPSASRVGEATTCVHRALMEGGVDGSTATHFTILTIDALTADRHLR